MMHSPLRIWIAQIHGGDLHVESHAGKGSTFRIELLATGPPTRS